MDDRNLDAREALELLDHRAQTKEIHDSGPPTPELVAVVRERLEEVEEERDEAQKSARDWSEMHLEVQQIRNRLNRELRDARRQRDRLRKAVREAKRLATIIADQPNHWPDDDGGGAQVKKARMNADAIRDRLSDALDHGSEGKGLRTDKVIDKTGGSGAESATGGAPPGSVHADADADEVGDDCRECRGTGWRVLAEDQATMREPKIVVQACGNCNLWGDDPALNAGTPADDPTDPPDEGESHTDSAGREACNRCGHPLDIHGWKGCRRCGCDHDAWVGLAGGPRQPEDDETAHTYVCPNCGAANPHHQCNPPTADDQPGEDGVGEEPDVGPERDDPPGPRQAYVTFERDDPDGYRPDTAHILIEPGFCDFEDVADLAEAFVAGSEWRVKSVYDPYRRMHKLPPNYRWVAKRRDRPTAPPEAPGEETRTEPEGGDGGEDPRHGMQMSEVSGQEDETPAGKQEVTAPGEDGVGEEDNWYGRGDDPLIGPGPYGYGDEKLQTVPENLSDHDLAQLLTFAEDLGEEGGQDRNPFVKEAARRLTDRPTPDGDEQEDAVTHILDDYETAVSLAECEMEKNREEDTRAIAEAVIENLRAEQEHRETEPEGY